MRTTTSPTNGTPPYHMHNAYTITIFTTHLLGISGGGERSLSGVSLLAAALEAAAAAVVAELPAAVPPPRDPVPDELPPVALLLLLVALLELLFAATAAADPTFLRRLPSFDTTILIFSLLPRQAEKESLVSRAPKQ